MAYYIDDSTGDELYACISVIKIFMCYNLALFYFDYYHLQHEFVETHVVDSEKLKEKINLDCTNKNLTEEQAHINSVKKDMLDYVLDIESRHLNDEDVEWFDFTVIRDIAQCITGQMEGMFLILNQELQHKDTDDNTLKNIENNVYRAIEQVLLYHKATRNL